jgi:hypothetical protein
MTNFMKDINLFPVGTFVNVSDIDDYQNVQIKRISDSGVTIIARGHEIVVSGRSPATLVTNDTPAPTSTLENIGNRSSDNAEDSPTERVKRGTYTERMKNIKIPEGLFTIKQVAELNDIPINYALNWVKENCVEVGKAEKAEGQRGKAATLYGIK